MTGGVRHRLSFAVIFRDHFLGAPVADHLPVRLAETYQRPVTGTDGRHRQPDGSYRFLDVPMGAQRILWRDALTRTQGGWTRWDPEDPEVSMPLADPGVAIHADLWPLAHAAAPAGATGVRGRLIGPGGDGATVRITHQTVANDRFTRSDDLGDFLFLLPGALPPDADGLVPLRLSIEAPDGSPRQILPPGGGAPTSALDFTIPPRSVPRILFDLA